MSFESWDGVWQDAALVAIIILVAYAAVIWIAALVWTYRDIQARTRDIGTHVISVAVVFLFNLPGLLLYLILRPKETLAESYDRRLEAEALLHELREQPTCPTCRRRVTDDFVVCPYCRAVLRTACDSCGKGLASGWVICPFCGADRVTTAPQPARPVQQPLELPTTPRERATRVRRASTATHTPPASSRPAQPPASPDPAVDPGT
jgi:hypothetical protein